ncbi:peptidylprolyl isomerase [Ramlibacter sp. H39-3-26]|uniref:peptidylprolyl isomerase n=1 Tax=Curvibacter soli TaxID=3031331 RepID=UPI0023DB4821|nr:peptidylprolyl isomerase [Ramlibacter sp. H39-3-26]MDF1486399.1 peptidylprolyl isomerase [Ramlibacter sp. H39-3-26]
MLAREGKVYVTATDVLADVEQRVPPTARAKVLSSPETVSRMAATLLVRRVLAAEAEKAGLQADPKVAAALQNARDKILFDALLERGDADVQPGERALDDYARSQYQADAKSYAVPAQVRARHILVRGSDEQARTKAQKLLQEVRAGANFAELAQKNSDDPGSAQKGGDLGFFAPGKMVKPFDDAVEALKNPGDVSGLVETEFGLHIIQLEERRPASKRPYEEVREQLMASALKKLQLEHRQRRTGPVLEQAIIEQDAVARFVAAQQEPAPIPNK